jgi:hypothetical protein
MISVEDSQTLVSTFDTQYESLLSSIVTTQLSLNEESAALTSLINSGEASNTDIVDKTTTVNLLSQELASYKSDLKTLLVNYNEAETVLNESINITNVGVSSTALDGIFQSIQGPTGPTGPAGTSVQGPQGAKGREITEISAVTVDSLTISSSLISPSIAVSSATTDMLSASSCNTTLLTSENINVTGITTTSALNVSDTAYISVASITDMEASNVNISGVLTSSEGYVGTIITSSQPLITEVGTLTSLNVSGDVNLSSNTLVVDSTNSFVGINTNNPQYDLDINGSCNVSDYLTASNVTVSGLCTASQGFLGLMVSSSQPYIQGVGTLTSLSISGQLNAGSANIDGIVTSVEGFDGTLLTVDQPNITSVGTLSSLEVDGTLQTNNLLVSGLATASVGFVGSILTASQPAITGVGTLIGLTVSGIVTVANVSVSGITTSPYISGTLLTASQSRITSVGTLSNLNVSGVTTTTNLSVSGVLTSSGGISGTLIQSSQPNITSVGTLSSLTVSGTISGTSASISGPCTASTLFGTLLTASQPNVTQVGTLSSLTVSGTSTVGSLSVSGVSTFSSGLFGTLLTASQTNITGLGTLTNLNVSGVTTSSNVNVSGVCTATSFVGTLVTASQPIITSVGTQSSLTVSGTTTLGGQINQSYSGTSCFISTSSVTSANVITLTTGSGSTSFDFGTRGTTGNPSNCFYLYNSKSAGSTVNAYRLLIDSSGRLGIGTSSPNVNLDMGSTSSAIGTASNVAAYIGYPATSSSSSYGGVLIGSGASGTAPFVSASKTGSGTALSLSFCTNDATRMTIGSDGSVTIPGSLSVNGTDFTSAIGGLGYEQTWSTYTGRDILGSGGIYTYYYQNDTTRPIFVRTVVFGNTGSGYIQYALCVAPSVSYLSTSSTAVGSSTVVDYGYMQSSSDYVSLSGIVPVDYYYCVKKPSGTNGGDNIAIWSELR